MSAREEETVSRTYISVNDLVIEEENVVLKRTAGGQHRVTDQKVVVPELPRHLFDREEGGINKI